MTFEAEHEMGMRDAEKAKKLLVSNPNLRRALEKRQYPSETARQIMEELLPEWQTQFLAKNRGYGDMADDLGPAAQFVDIHRKVGKLKRGLWDQQSMGEEDAEEVAMDLIGHCFLLLRQLRPRYQAVESDGA